MTCSVAHGVYTLAREIVKEQVLQSDLAAQGIAIRQELKNAAKVLETPGYKVLSKALSVFTKF